MGLLLDFVYLLAAVVLSPWLAYRLCTPGRRDVLRRFGLELGGPLRASVWLHGSSAGEVALLRPLIAMLERDLPGTPLVISAFTVNGLAAARKLKACVWLILILPWTRLQPIPIKTCLLCKRWPWVRNG